jgi:serine/threonine protein kinase
MLLRARAFSASTGNLQQQQRSGRSSGVGEEKDQQRVMSRRSYAIVGSPDYMCPEMLEGAGYDHRGDIWSLGCILYEMVAGFGPFMGTSAE